MKMLVLKNLRSPSHVQEEGQCWARSRSKRKRKNWEKSWTDTKTAPYKSKGLSTPTSTITTSTHSSNWPEDQPSFLEPDTLSCSSASSTQFEEISLPRICRQLRSWWARRREATWGELALTPRFWGWLRKRKRGEGDRSDTWSWLGILVHKYHYSFFCKYLGHFWRSWLPSLHPWERRTVLLFLLRKTSPRKHVLLPFQADIDDRFGSLSSLSLHLLFLLRKVVFILWRLSHLSLQPNWIIPRFLHWSAVAGLFRGNKLSASRQITIQTLFFG